MHNDLTQLTGSSSQIPRDVDSISPTSRHLLGSGSSAETITQYCYPSGNCDLTDLHDGLSGFMLQGEMAGDNSGISVSSAGDINGDGLADLLLGAYYANSTGRVHAGKTYVVFGSNQTNAWGSGVLNLSSVIDGQRGFVLQGEAAGDTSGWSVSSAGDVNGDRLDDMLISAHYAGPTGPTGVGKTYIVFGANQTNAWGSGILNLASLMNGQRGFVLQGEVAEDYSSASVSNAGDINGDGFADMLIGAYGADVAGRTDAGKTYVIFGSNQTNAWGSGVFNITSLMNGQRGFVLQGEAAGDISGYCVSNAGDINGDGFDDLLINALYADPDNRTDAGKNYVVFGSNQTNAWGSGVLNLISLMDGRRGFVLQGEASNDYNGYSVSSAGDINGDGFADLLVGAPYADLDNRTDAGKTYVVFGSNQTNAWGLGVLNLTSLMDGQRGFMLQGEAADDHFGVSVSSAGDVNGDSLADVLVSASGADVPGRIDAGKSYVVFGSNQTNAWNFGVLNITSLMDGQRGFVLQGEMAGDYIGAHHGVSGAGDINGDGMVDILVGAPYADPANRTDAGKSHVVFGDKSAQLWANQLTLNQGIPVVLNSQNLNATYAKPIHFNITGVTHGQFEYVNNPGQVITSFNQTEVWNGKVRFVHDGGAIPPSYTVEILSVSKIVRFLPQNATITFYEKFTLANQLTIHQGETLLMNDTFLNITSNYSPDQVNITISNLRHGQFVLTPLNGSVLQFSQLDLLDGHVLFTHDNSSFAPSYDVSLDNPTASVSPNAVQTLFFRRPIWFANQLTLTQGDSLFLSDWNINVTEDASANNVQFTINGLQHGEFRLAPANNTITAFSQQQLWNKTVLFVHDNSGNAPNYQLSLSDNYFTLPPEPMSVNFTRLPPMLSNNSLTVLQGRNKTLTSADLSATDPDLSYNLSTLIFMVSNVQHGQFRVQGNSTIMTQFTQGQVTSGKIFFAHDDSTTAPSYQVVVNNGYRNSSVQAANISFDARPVMFNNRLTIGVGDSVVLGITDLRAIDDTTVSDDILLRVSNVEHGYFSQLQAPNTSITSFLQVRIRDAEIQFQQDGSLFAPSYTITAVDGSALESYPQNANINFQSSAKAAGGIDLTKLYASVSSVGGLILAVAGYFWWRRRVASHRRGYDFANSLRKAANLEYHDFMRFDGEVYKTKVDTFLAQLKPPHSNFYNELTIGEKKSFAVCAAEVLQERNLLSPSDYADGVYGWFFGFSVGWSRKLDVKEFEKQAGDIARQAVAAWQAEAKPQERWLYHSPTTGDKVKAWCCARPSQAGVFAPRNSRSSRSEQGVALQELKHSAPASPSMHQKEEGEVVISMETSASSPRLFGTSGAAVVTEDRLKVFEQQVSGQLREISEGMRSINKQVERLETETRPLLIGMSSSSS